MPNDFEKQVRQKMEELDFVPGAPVWTNIEEQIRKKKERRRVIFWIPFFALLLTGGIVWLNRNNGSLENDLKKDNAASNQTNMLPKHNQPGDEATSTGLNSQATNKNLSISTVSKNQFTTKVDETPNSLAGTKTFHSNSSGVEKYKKSNKESVEGGMSKDRAAVNGETNQPQAGNITNDNSVKLNAVAIEGNKQVDKIESKDTRLIEETSVETKNDTVSIARIDSIQTIAATSLPKPVLDVSWRIGIVGGAGISGMAEGLNVFGQEKMYDAQSSNLGSSSPGSFAPYRPQVSVKNGFSFFAGVSALKNLSKKFQFSAGLEYQYVSNQTQIGRDSLSSYVAMALSMDPRIRATGDHQFVSQYHFISLPIDMAYQLLKKNPLRISAGLSVQQMVSVNALVYDSKQQNYETSEDAFTKTQLFSRLGLNYTLDVKSHQLTFGPQLNYGLSNLLKDGDDKRLYSFGLRTAFIF